MFRWNERYQPSEATGELSIYEKMKYLPLNQEDAYLSLGGSLRERLNMYENDRFGLLGADDGKLLLHRFMFHADLHINQHVRIFGEIGNQLTVEDDLTPGPFDDDSLDLAQAFIDLSLLDSTLRLGRQEFSLGSARLVSVRNGPNIRRAFDGFLLDTTLQSTGVQLFAMNEVLVEGSNFDNSSNGDEGLWGAYLSRSYMATEAEVYYIGHYRGGAEYAQGQANDKRHTLGMHLEGGHEGWRWDYEFMYQFGRFGQADIDAWSLATITSYTLENVHWTPRFALSANIASGDDDPNDNKLNTFNPLYPNLSYFEEAAILAPQNFFNIEPEITIQPTSRLSMSFDWNFFWRYENADAVYVRGLLPLPGTAGGSGSFVAHVPSLSVDYTYNKYLAADLSYSHFFAGDAIENAGGSDIDFLKLEVNYTF